MKRLILSALVFGAASQAAGCIITDDDPTGSVTVSWQPLTVDFQSGDTLNTTCPPLATSAIVFAQPVGSDPGDAYEDKFDCADISNTVADLPTGQYDVYVRLKDTSENTTFAESGSTRINITDGGLTSVDAAMYVDQGFYTLDWTLTGAGAPATCAQVAGENGVSIVATVSGGSTFVDTIRDCEDGGDGVLSYTDPMPLTEAGYTVVASLLNAQDESIGDSQAIVGPELVIGNQAFDIGTADIVLR